MARVVPISQRNIIEGGRTYFKGRAVEIDDEGLYHHLIRTNRLRNADHILRPINAARLLPRLRPGTFVTIVREVGLGDVLMVLVVIRALKKKYPGLLFSLATGRAYLPILQSMDFLHQVESLMDLKGTRGNVIDLRNVAERDSQRENMERIDIFARACGVDVRDYSLPHLDVTSEERGRARGLIGDGPGQAGPVIALAVRGSTHVRTWPLDSVRSFAAMAALRGWTVAVLDGGRHEMPESPGIVNLTGQLGMLDVKAVIAESTICVSPDSGLQHLAEAVGTKCLALYSTTPPALRIAHYAHVKALWRQSLPCVPCHDRGCAPAPCMHIAPSVVLRGIENWDRLERVTNIDRDPIAVEIPDPISVEAEQRIMQSWPVAV